MLAPISSVPVETVVTLLLTCSAAADATLAWAAVSSALTAICWLTAINSWDALARTVAFSATCSSRACRFLRIVTCSVTSVAYLTTLKGRPLRSRIGLYSPLNPHLSPPLPRRRYSPATYSPRPNFAQNSLYSALLR